MAKNVMAVDELLATGQEAKGRRDDAAKELAGIVKALSGLGEIGMLDESQKRALARLRPTRRRRTRRRTTA